MKIICGIYCITNLLNNKKYIGLSKNCLRRWNEHKYRALHPKRKDDTIKPLYCAIRKYGIENFSFEIVEICEYKNLKEREIYWIEYFDSYTKGYNATLGGDLPEGHILKGEKHGCSKIKDKDVEKCRELYSLGISCKEAYQNILHFQNKIGYSGFQRMYYGMSWKHIRPEVFEKRTKEKRKISDEEVKKIKELWFNGYTIKEILELTNKKYSRTSISDIVNNKRYIDVTVNVKDNHPKRRKLSEEEVKQIFKWKEQGKLNREIVELLQYKVSKTTISDILNYKRYN